MTSTGDGIDRLTECFRLLLDRLEDEVAGDGDRSHSLAINQDVDHLVGKASRLVNSIPEWHDLAAVTSDDEWLRRLDRPSSASPGHLVSSGPLRHLLRNYLADNSLEWNGDAFAKLVSLLDEYLTSGLVPILLCGALENFESPISRAELGDGMDIRRIPSGDIRALWHAFGSVPDVLPSQVPRWSHAVCARRLVEKSRIGQAVTSREWIFRAVTALRLAKHGRVGVTYVWAQGDGPVFVEVMAIAQPVVRPLYAVPPEYRLDESELAPVAQLLDALPQHVDDRRFRLALDRFNVLYERLNPIDRLIDSWIGLEALFAPDGKSGEVAFRTSLRIAILLGQSDADRKALFALMKKSYDRRSRVAHGQPAKPDTSELASSTEDVLRRALRGFLDVEWPRTANAMNERLLERGTR